jgi:hypothetical protein
MSLLLEKRLMFLEKPKFILSEIVKENNKLAENFSWTTI